MKLRWLVIASSLILCMPLVVPASPSRVHLRIGIPVTPPSIAHIGPFVAKELGYFNEVGLDVDILQFDSGVRATQALVSGGVDAILSSSEPVIIGIARGADLKIIYSFSHKLTVVMVAADRIRTLQALKGARMGVQEVGAFREILSRAVLIKAGLTPQDVQYVSIGSAGYIPALVAGRIDTAVLQADQTAEILRSARGLRILVRYWDLLPDYWYGAYAVKEDQLRTNMDVLTNMVKAIITAHRALYTDRKLAVDVITKYTGFPRPVAEQAYAFLVQGGAWPVNDGIPKRMIDYTVDRLVEWDLLKAAEKPSYARLVDRRPSSFALREMGRWTGDPRWR